MKTPKAFRLLLLLLSCACLLCACSSVRKLKVNDNDTYTDRRSGVTYRPLPACYEPATLGAEYASFKLGDVTTTLHVVSALPPENFLGSMHNATYANEALDIPDFAALDISRVLIYAKSAPSIPSATLQMTEETHGAVILALREAYLNGTRVSYPSFYRQDAAYTLRFEATNLPGVYYCFSYIEYAEDIYEMIDGEERNLGRYFLYDRYNKICVAIDGALRAVMHGK